MHVALDERCACNHFRQEMKIRTDVKNVRRINDEHMMIEAVDIFRKGKLDIIVLCETRLRSSGTFKEVGGKGVKSGPKIRYEAMREVWHC